MRVWITRQLQQYFWLRPYLLGNIFFQLFSLRFGDRLLLAAAPGAEGKHKAPQWVGTGLPGLLDRGWAVPGHELWQDERLLRPFSILLRQRSPNQDWPTLQSIQFELLWLNYKKVKSVSGRRYNRIGTLTVQVCDSFKCNKQCGTVRMEQLDTWLSLQCGAPGLKLRLLSYGDWNWVEHVEVCALEALGHPVWTQNWTTLTPSHDLKVC